MVEVRRGAAARRSDPERPLVWIDDDLFGAADMAEWTSTHARSLLVVPDPMSGLTIDDLDAVDAFLGSLGSREH
jgi:hypothetical protein